MKTPHKHAALIKQFAEDMAIDIELISKWKYRLPQCESLRSIDHAPQWIEDYEYHREPDTININGVEVPEPVREPLERGDTYCLAEDPQPFRVCQAPLRAHRGLRR